MMTYLKLLLFCLILIVSQTEAQKIVYVDAALGGDNEACGSSSNACKSISYGFNRLQDSTSGTLVLRGRFEGSNNNGLAFRLKPGISLTIQSDENNDPTVIACNGQNRFLRLLVEGQNDDNVNVTLRGFTIQDCVPKDDPTSGTLEGGALVFAAGKTRTPVNIVLDSMTITRCRAPSSTGGAISLKAPSNRNRRNVQNVESALEELSSLAASKFTLLVQRSTISDCSASSGGAIALSGFNARFESSHFSENKADRSGGVLYSDYSNVDAINSNFISNKARDGSVMYGETSNQNFVSCTLKNNTATYSGALYGYIVQASFIDSTAESNTAGYGGGFFYGQRYSVIKITNSLVKLNNGGFYGGGLHLYGDSVATIERSTLSSNRAGYGGAINVDVHSKINATSSFLTANQAREGGALYAQNAAKSYIIDTSFTDNQASTRGSAFWCANSAFYVRSTTLNTNTSSSRDEIMRNFYCSPDPPFTRCDVTGDENWDALCADVYTPLPEPLGFEGGIAGFPAWFVGTLIACGAVVFLAAIVCAVLVILRRREQSQAQLLVDELERSGHTWSPVPTGEDDISACVGGDDVMVEDIIGQTPAARQGGSLLDDDELGN